MIPGMNLLKVALGAIASQHPVTYLRATGTQTTNAAGYVEPAFEAPQVVKLSSVQAVARTSYQFLGLDLSKTYVNWYVPAEIVGLDRNTSGDRFTYAGKLYQVVNTTEWAAQDGWTAALSVRLEPGHA